MPDLGVPVGNAPIARVAPAKPRHNKRRARVTVDKRFAVGRRVKELTLRFRERAGSEVDQDPLLLAAVERAARLTALAEQASARALSGDERVTLDDVVRLNRLSESAVRALRLDRRDTKQTTPTLSAYLAARAGGTP
jgi:hypothetical protein